MSDVENDPRAIWREQPTEVPIMSVAYLRHRTSELERSFRLRSILEQSACVLAIGLSLGILLLEQEPWKKAGAVVMIVGVLYAFIQWRRRTATEPDQAFEVAAAGIVFYRRELERKRDIHRNLWCWYLLPCFFSGTAFILLGIFFGDLSDREFSPWLVLGLMAAAVIGTAVYERSKAAKYQREIDALNSLDRNTQVEN